MDLIEIQTKQKYKLSKLIDTKVVIGGEMMPSMNSWWRVKQSRMLSVSPVLVTIGIKETW